MDNLRHIASALCMFAVGTLIVGCSDLVDRSDPGDGEPAPSPGWKTDDASHAPPGQGSGDGQSTEEHSEEDDSPEFANAEPDPNAAPVDVEVRRRSDYVAHEWGTFTSVVGSDGEYLPGLHHEGVSLPAFVHEFEHSGPCTFRNPDARGVSLPEPVTQKLETPVIYFYPEGPVDVRVQVDFPKGFFNKWYPDNVAQSPTQPGCVECDGVGRSEPPFTIRASETPEGPKFDFVNASDRPVPQVYLMKIGENEGRITELGGVDANSTRTESLPSETFEKETFVRVAEKRVRAGLEETGLTAAEAEAMVETWAHSYFRATGHRVLYILPRAWTDRMLPIEMEPAPEKLVRTLVGRVEVMTPAVERKTLERLREAKSDGRRLERVYRGGRFEEPHFRRACELADESAMQEWCERELRALCSEKIDEDGRSGY